MQFLLSGTYLTTTRTLSFNKECDTRTYLYQKKHPHIREIYITDDSFLINNQRVLNFCNAVIENNLPFKFICSGHIHSLSYEAVQKLEKAGFILIDFGLETANENIAKSMGKPLNKKKA